MAAVESWGNVRRAGTLAALLACASGWAVAVTPGDGVDRPQSSGSRSSLAKPGRAQTDRLSAVAAQIDAGRFREARERIQAALASPDLDPAQRAAWTFQRERMRRILLDFTVDERRVKAQVREQIPDLRDDEFARWDRAGRLEHLRIDGEKRYFNRAASNLFRLEPEALARRPVGARPLRFGPMEVLNPHHAEVRDAALAQHRDHVAPRRVRVTQTLTVNADAVPDGKIVRAWLPYPRAIAGQQDNIRWLGSEPERPRIAPESAPQRTVYLERLAKAGEPTRFSINYELTVFGQYHAIDPARIVPTPANADMAPYLGERPPHIVYTDAIRKFSRDVVGDETHPYRIARKLYAAVDRIPWAGAREYSTLSNISDHTLRMGHGDCGQQTLLLITLLRLNGIPARWQSGMVYSDTGYDNMHDWAWLYLAPYGWLPVDVTTGRFDSGDPALADFYFGGLDAYRIAFNDDYGRDFVPAKQYERSETVDSQRGEVEWDGGNLYFDQWDYGFDAQVVPAEGAAATRGG